LDSDRGQYTKLDNQYADKFDIDGLGTKHGYFEVIIFSKAKKKSRKIFGERNIECKEK